MIRRFFRALSPRSSGAERGFPKAQAGGASPSEETKPIRCPKGYRFKITHRMYRSSGYISSSLPKGDTRIIQVQLINTHLKEEVGYVDLVMTIDRFWETHSALDALEQGKGLGVLMYAKAISVGLKHGRQIVKSSARPSAQAIRVWKSRRLNNVYDITREGKRFRVIARKAECH